MNSLAETEEDKLAAVRKAYLTDIIPGIQNVFEQTNRVRESFILVHCAILSISGFYAGTKATTGATYKRFVHDFLPKEYSAHQLWKDLRNSLVHGYTITQTYVLAHRHPEMHLRQAKGVRSQRTGVMADLTYLNLEDFLEDFRQATTTYFGRVEAEPDLLDKLCARYDVAPPATYVADENIADSLRSDFMDVVHLQDGRTETTAHGKELQTAFELSAEIRGKFLDLVLFAEAAISDIIARHFCPDDEEHMLFFSVVMSDPDLKFSTKIQMLEQLLRLRYSDILTQQTDLIDDLDRVRLWRNRLAHSHLDTSGKFLSKGHKDRIQLIFYEKGRRKQQVITLEQSRTKMGEVFACIRELAAVQEEIYARLGLERPSA